MKAEEQKSRKFKIGLEHGGYASQVALVVKNLPANAGNKEIGFNTWVRKIPWRREWQPTTVFLPGEFHEQRSLAGYSPWDSK